MEYLIIALVSVWAVEIFLKLPVRRAVDDLWRVSQKAIHTVSSPHISDHWKEKVMLTYARQSFTRTLKLAFFVLVFISVTLVPVFISDYCKLTTQPVLPVFATTAGLVISTLVAICYYWLRSRVVK